jgi:hypothetical protein
VNRYTISPDFLEYVAKNSSSDYLLNVLIVFAQDNQYKLCMDKRGYASSQYEKIIESSDHLRFWVNMLNNKKQNIEAVEISDKIYKDYQELFVEIAKSVPPGKRLVTSDKSLYNRLQEEIAFHNVHLIDGDEAKVMMRAPINVQISYGDNSPNINGNNNSVT